MDGDLLDEEESFWGNIADRLNDVSSDAIVDDSFSELRELAASTPSTSKALPRRSTRIRDLSPAPGGTSPRSPTASPRRSAGRAEAEGSPASSRLSPGPGPCTPSPRRSSRLRDSSPSPAVLSPGPSTDSPRRSSRLRDSSPACTRTPPRSSVQSTVGSQAPQSRPGRSASPRPPPPPPAPACPTSTGSRSRPGSVRGPAHGPVHGPAHGPARVRGPGSNAQKEKPSSSKMKCPKCPATLANRSTFENHLRTHVMKGIASKAPSAAELLNAMPSLIEKALDDIISDKVIGEFNDIFHKYCVSFLEAFKKDSSGVVDEIVAQFSDGYHGILETKKALFPSSMRSSVYIGVNKLLSSEDFRRILLENVVTVCEGETSVLNVFIGNVMLHLSKKVIVFISQKMRLGVTEEVSTVRKKRSQDEVSEKAFQQLVYHIGGSIVHCFLYKGKKYRESGSHAWRLYCDVLSMKFIRSESGDTECSEEVRAHTDKQDRGGLTHLSNSAFDLFLVMFDFLMGLEGDDGSLPADVIDAYVLQNDVILCLWDVLVGDDLPEENDSIDLLVQISQSAVDLTMKGILKRRLNEYLKKSYSSVALRARLAS